MRGDGVGDAALNLEVNGLTVELVKQRLETLGGYVQSRDWQPSLLWESHTFTGTSILSL